ncbi:MAG: ATP-binding protein [Gammaproteobacteria bacterium]|nr:ATP-binding protein [Gammaproteobacteria bacterium]
MYKPRTLSRTIHRVSGAFPILFLTGPRQVGKTTLLEHCGGDRGYVTLDDLEQREIARNDPALFLQMHPAPATIDEVQYAPQLFGQLKLAVDRAKQPGMYWLTGSQKFHLMQGITETLAGRVAIIDLLGFSQAEIDGRAESSEPFAPTDDWLANAKAAAGAPKRLMDIYQRIWLGAFPGPVLGGEAVRDIFYSSYIQTYIQRDVRALSRVGDELAFHRLLRAAAARTGQLVNFADLARDVEVDQKTVKAWLSILETAGLIHLLRPYHSNLTKRLVKTPKLHFLDTGLCAYLTGWSSPETLEAGALSGAILETWMFAEILKSYWHNGLEARFHFYRDKDRREVDLLIERDNQIHPVEFKKTASPSQSATASFSALVRLGKPLGPGAVVCLKETDARLAKDIVAIPAGLL